MAIRRDYWLVIALLLFVVSLGLPAVQLGRHDSAVGLICLEYGWWAVPWYANILLSIGAMSLRCGWPGASLSIGVVAIFVALSTFSYARVDELQAGFYVWVASMVAFAVACAKRRLWSARVNRKPPRHRWLNRPVRT